MAARTWQLQLSVDAATQSVHLQASASLTHVAGGAAAALLLLVMAKRLCSSRPAAKQHSQGMVRKSKQGAAASADVQPAGTRDQCDKAATAAASADDQADALNSDTTRPAFDAIVGDPFEAAEDPFKYGDEDAHRDGDREYRLGEYGEGDPFEGDPFGYGGTAQLAPPATAASSGGSAAASGSGSGSGSGVAAAATAIRRASMMAAGEAAGALKDAFLRAANASWANEEEEARVNALPASAQRQLQAGGRWARDGEGRLVRHGNSARRLQAVRASLVAAAAAVTKALSGGGSGTGGGAAEPADADALAQLMAAAPGQVVGFGA
jgi:hypothetical protein